MGAYDVIRLYQAELDVKAAFGYWGTSRLLDAIDDALVAPQLSEEYSWAITTGDAAYALAVELDTASVKVATLVLQQLPAAMEGALTKDYVEASMKQLSALLAHASDGMEVATNELGFLGREMEQLAERDSSGVEQLNSARARLVKIDGYFEYDSTEMHHVHESACSGVAARLHAHSHAKIHAERVTDLLYKTGLNSPRFVTAG